MITDSFDKDKAAILNPWQSPDKFKCDICIVTFSHEIEKYVEETFELSDAGIVYCVCGIIPIRCFEYAGKRIAFYKTFVGASAAAGILEEVIGQLDTEKYLFFGSAGCLNNEIGGNRVVVPAFAYRDEGTSYHYSAAKDMINIANSGIVEGFMRQSGVPFETGGIWTTDALYRETRRNMNRRKADGCIAVDMECSAIQAVCDFREKELYYFVITGDLLDSPEWQACDLEGANHNSVNFHIALALALYAIQID